MKNVKKSVFCFAMAVGLLCASAMADTIIAPTAHGSQQSLRFYGYLFAWSGNDLRKQARRACAAFAGRLCRGDELAQSWLHHPQRRDDRMGRPRRRIYTESRTMYGIGPYRAWKINQGSQNVNYIRIPPTAKLGPAAWTPACAATRLRRSSLDQRHRYRQLVRYHGSPGRSGQEAFAQRQVLPPGVPWGPRGWQTWEYVGGEVAICEPFITHAGVTIRAGVDLSEVMDFVLGIVCIDFKQDDRRLGE